MPSKKAKVASPLEASEAHLSAGSELYGRECASCHGEAGRGDGPGAVDVEGGVPSFVDGRISGQTDGALFYKLSTGRDSMPGYRQSMTEEELWQLVQALRQIAPTPQDEPRIEVDRVPAEALGLLWEHYRALCTALAAEELEAAAGLAADWPSSAAPEGFEPSAQAAWDARLGAMATAAGAVAAAEGAKDQRAGFAALSSAYVEFARDFGPGELDSVYVVHRQGRRATHEWVVASLDAPDPFGGDPLLACVVRQLVPARDPSDSEE
ncbi:MAG: c-type cytochrome [Planctomycetota bacterium]